MADQSELDLGLPDAPKSSPWQDLRRYLRDVNETGGIISAGQAAKVLDVSTQAVINLANRGRLQRYDYPSLGMWGIPAAQVYAYLRERKAGMLNRQGRGNRLGVAGTAEIA